MADAVEYANAQIVEDMKRLHAAELPPATEPRNLRGFIREENKKIVEQLRRLEERLSNLEKMIG